MEILSKGLAREQALVELGKVSLHQTQTDLTKAVDAYFQIEDRIRKVETLKEE